VRRVIISSVIAGSSVAVNGRADQTLPVIRDDHRKLLARFSAITARSLAACSAELHHQLGPDLFQSLGLAKVVRFTLVSANLLHILSALLRPNKNREIQRSLDLIPSLSRIAC
jgi:hypothetical protein